MKRLVVLVPCPQAVKEQLLQLTDAVFLPPDAQESLIRQAMSDAEIVIGEPALPLVQAATHLRYLQMTWAGTDRYTNVPGFPPHVALCNLSGVYGVTIAEHAFAMLLALCRRLPAYFRQQRQGLWQDLGPEKALFGATALILGTGDLGGAIARRCHGFGMTAIGLCRSARPIDGFDEVYAISALAEQLPRADVVFGCLPDTPQTRLLLDGQRLGLLPKGAVVINVGRGSLIDLSALTSLLASGRLWGAGLDVTEPEPLPAEHPLRQLDNVILTPHVAGVGFGHLPQTEAAIWRFCLDNLNCYLSNMPLKNLITERS